MRDVLQIVLMSDNDELWSAVETLLLTELTGYQLTRAEALTDAAACSWDGQADLVLLDIDAAGAAALDEAREVVRQVRVLFPTSWLLALSARRRLARPLLMQREVDDFFVPDADFTWEEEKLAVRIVELIGHWAADSAAADMALANLRKTEGASCRWFWGPKGCGRGHLAGVVWRGTEHRRNPELVMRLAAMRWDMLSALSERAPGHLMLRQAEVLPELAVAEQTALLTALQRCAETGWMVSFIADRAADDVRPLDVSELEDWIQTAPSLAVPGLRQRREDFSEIVDVLRRTLVADEVVEIMPIDSETVDGLWERYVERGWEMRRALREVERVITSTPLGVIDLAGEFLDTEQYAYLRGGEHRAEGTMHASDMLGLLESEKLVMVAEDGRGGHHVVECWVDGDKRAIDDERIGRLLWLLVAAAGESVDLNAHRSDLGLHRDQPLKHHIYKARQAIDDEVVEGRRGRYISSHYRGTYSFEQRNEHWLFWPRRGVGDDAQV
ncbi:MAG: hypothetical protein GF393_10325 [Armatimonadia bacterium]|nr:hypothetical protein [Armatimonadia bacterium]